MATFSRKFNRNTFEGERKDVPGKDRKMRVDEMASEVVRLRKSEGARERTLTDYKKFFEEFREEAHPLPKYADELTADDFRKFINRLLERGLEPATVNIRMNAVRSVVNHLFKKKLIGESNPVESVKKLKVDQNASQPLEDNQIRRIFSVVDKNLFSGYRDYCAMLLMLKSGLRINEVNALDETDINFDQRYILLPGSKNKNRKTRIVPITEQVAEELRTLIEEQHYYFGDVEDVDTVEENEEEGSKEVTNVFRNTDGSPISENGIRRNMYRYKQRAGLPSSCKVSPHTLRHTFAVNFMRLGGDIRALMEILGHTSLETTQVYLKYSKDTILDRYRIVEEKDDFSL
ncbi:tyrosine-type recombinase/integrase [Gracilibacillus timonensis]|uniref:tyrosine-type recombinase/integrase n=1 Tax=Gracilibacillus timonensis TaxID=1816696 RepID=UPI0008267A46|nr:tyrosine-type recombinase/integrase [Gracilibacillus timonensis]